MMDRVILLGEVNKFEEGFNDFQAFGDGYNDDEFTSDVKVKLEDLHHSIDIKEEPPILEYERDSNEDLPLPSKVDDHRQPPERSRLRRSNQRRPQTSKLEIVALKYEEVADLKKEVLGLQRDYYIACRQGLQEKLRWETNQRRMEEVRRVEEFNFKKEEFNLKKRSLELDIKIKKTQLELLKKCVT